MLPAQWRTPRLTVRNVRAGDAALLDRCLVDAADAAALDPHFGPAPWADLEALVERSLAQEAAETPDFQCQLFFRDGDEQPAGYWHFVRVPGRAGVVGVTLMLVRPAYRRQGLGEEVIGNASRQLAGWAQAFWARVFLKNVPAIEFWARQGFVLVTLHREQFVIGPPDTPSLILCRPLPGPAVE